MKQCVFNKLNIGAIPTSFQNAFSIEDQILWLQKNLNDAITLLNQVKEEVDNIDINFEEIEESINSLSEELNSVKERVTLLEENKASKEELSNAINTLDAELKALINQEYSILKDYVDTQDEYLQYQIDHFDIGNITLLDPTTGLQSSIQVVIDNIYDQTRTDGITAAEFDALQLTATGFDEKEITAFNFDQHGKTLLEE
jgi:DNA repair exonuclease SbcCD ATPase subunit